jgi:ADP-ribosylglycohydrolase
MFGAVAGDVIGSCFEFHTVKTTDFPLFGPRSTFTDDSVLTVAVAYALLKGQDYVTCFKRFGCQYPHAGWGGSFQRWLFSDETAPYNSFGNGSAMRVSPVGFACSTVSEVLEEAKHCAEVTHNHPEGIKGAQATALAIFLARQGVEKPRIQAELEQRFGYNLSRKVEDIRPEYVHDETCQKSVPESIIAFLQSKNYEDAVRLAVSLGGDCDTMACIAGGIAQAYYGTIPEIIKRETIARLPQDFVQIVEEFDAVYGIRY